MKDAFAPARRWIPRFTVDAPNRLPARVSLQKWRRSAVHVGRRGLLRHSAKLEQLTFRSFMFICAVSLPLLCGRLACGLIQDSEPFGGVASLHNRGELSPFPLAPLEQETEKPELPTLTETAEEIDFAKLADLLEARQLESLAGLRTVRCFGWSNYRSDGSTTNSPANVGSVKLLDIVEDFEHGCSREIRRWLRLGMSREEKMQRFPPDSFMARQARIWTPSMIVEGESMFTDGIDNITLRGHNDDVWIDGIGDFRCRFLGAEDKPVDEFWAELRGMVGNGFYSTRCRQQGQLVELLVWRPDLGPERGRRWVFDLDQGGFAIAFENLIFISSTRLYLTEFARFDGYWLPLSTEYWDHNIPGKHTLQHCQNTYWDFQVNVPVEGEFSVRSLPVHPTLKDVRDTRSGRLVLVPLAEIED